MSSTHAPTSGLSLSEALRVIQRYHPHWHIWRTGLAVMGTRRDDLIAAEAGGPGVQLDAPTPERLDQVLAEFEHKHGWPA